MTRQPHRNRNPVTLEGKAELGGAIGSDRFVASRLRLRSLFAEVFDAHTALDRPYRKPPLVREDGDTSAGNDNVANFNIELSPTAAVEAHFPSTTPQLQC